MTHSQKIFRNTIFSFGNKILTIILSFITRKLFIMYLSAELLGLNSLFADLLGLLNLADMGLGIAVQFNLYKPLAEGDKNKIGRILNASKHIYNLVGFFMIIVGVVLSFFIQFLIKENPYDLYFLRLVFIINVFSSASTYFFVHKRLFMQVTENLHITNTIDSILNLVCSILKISVIVIWGNYIAFVMIGAIQAFVSNFVVSIECDKRYPYLKEVKGYTKDELSPLLANIKELVPNKVSSFIFSNTDNTIISTFLGLTSVAIFANYNGIVIQIFMMAAMIASIMKVSFGNILQNKEDVSNHVLFLNAYQLLQFFYSSFCGVTLFCLLDEFVEVWYGAEYVAPFVFVIILTLDFYVHSMYQPLSMMLEALGEFKSLKNQVIFTMILNIAISIGLVVPFGIIGPILGTFMVDIFTIIFRLYSVLYKYYREHLGMYIKKLVILSSVFVVEYVGVYLICEYMPMKPSFISMIVKVVICFILTMVTNILVTYRMEEFKYLKERLVAVVKK